MTQASDPRPTKGPYSTFFYVIRRYFSDYGGWRGLACSPFLHCGLVLTVLSYSTWTSGKWTESVTGIIPNLLGFSLGTYALLFSLMSNRMKQALKHLRNKAGIPYLDEINATFFHFIMVQTICLSWALLMRSTIVYDLAVYWSAPSSVFRVIGLFDDFAGFVGYSLLSYSLVLVIASSLAVYRLARIVDRGAGT